MKKISKNRVQELFITHLLKEGYVELLLPNNMVLEVGITQENRNGDLEKVSDYCWVIASQNGRAVSIDDYNLGLRYEDDTKMIFEHKTSENVNVFDVI